MAVGTIRKKDLSKLIAAVSADGRFYGPAWRPEGVRLCEITPDDEVAFDYANFKLPGKHCFFPRREVIATYDAEGMSEALPATGKVVLFGLRPCDALSLLYLDKVFLDEDPVDPYYRSRREHSLVISLACSAPARTCFCTSVGASPSGKEGADVLAFDLGETLLFEGVTEKGEAFLGAHSGLFENPTEEEIAARDAQAAGAEKKVPVVDTADIAEKLPGLFESPLWDEAAQRCLSCGVCAFSCPTCHCFGLYDEKVGPVGRRVRAQGTCMFPLFTAEASGHNPRTHAGQRMRQRIMHKFRYTAENFGEIFCVGCGRCITNCPVNMDIRETVAEVSQ